MASTRFEGLGGKGSDKTAEELFSTISDLLDMDVVGNIVFARGNNATGKTLAINAVRALANYYCKVRGCPVKVVYAPLEVTSSDYRFPVSSGEERVIRLEEALSDRLKEGTNIVLIDDFALLPDNRRKEILKTLKEKIDSKRAAFALIGEVSDDEKLGIWKETKR